MNTFIKYFTVPITLALSAMVITPSVQAQDSKNYAGAACVKWNAAQPTPSLNWARIWNPSSAADLNVDCIAVKDGTNVAGGWVRVIDRHPTLPVSCQLVSTWSSSEAGVFASLSPVLSSVGASPNVQQLNYGARPGYAMGHLFYSCSVPRTSAGARSWITTYQVREN